MAKFEQWLLKNDQGQRLKDCGLVVQALDYLFKGPRSKNHWVLRRLTQPFILPRSIRLVPRTPRDLVVKSKLLSPGSDSAVLRQLNPILKKAHKVLKGFFRSSDQM